MRPVHIHYHGEGVKQPWYVNRPLGALSADSLRHWCRMRGMTLMPDPHVTIVYSKQAFDIDRVPAADAGMVIAAGSRSIDVFDGGAVVLAVRSDALTRRWQEYIDAGASWDYDGFRAHITLCYADDMKSKPMLGDVYDEPIVLAGEQRAALDIDHP